MADGFLRPGGGLLEKGGLRGTRIARVCSYLPQDCGDRKVLVVVGSSCETRFFRAVRYVQLHPSAKRSEKYKIL